MNKQQARALVVAAIQQNQTLQVTNANGGSYLTCGPVYNPTGTTEYTCRRINRTTKSAVNLGTDIYAETAATAFMAWAGADTAAKIAKKALDR